MATNLQNRLFRSPAQLLAIVVLAIFAIEVLLMFVRGPLPRLPNHRGEIVDVILLILLLLPILYTFLFYPLSLYAAALRRSEEVLEQQRDRLEEMARNHTAELDERTQEFADREVHFRAVVEGASESILTLDREGHVARFNAAVQKMFGYGPNDLTGMPLAKLLTADSANRCIKPDGSLYPVSGLSLEAQNKTGETLPVLLSLSTFDYKETQYFTATIRDISERVMFEKHLAQLAYYDSLTGLPNRRLFHDRLSQAMKRAERNEKMVGIMFLDLDHFKDINDTLGHLFGDRLLQEVTQRLQQQIRKEDTVARLGGDEFTIILESISNIVDAEGVAKKILHVLRQPFQLGTQEVYVTSSIGITLYPMDDSDIEKLIMNADAAMFQAKSHGRNTYELYTAKILSGAAERLALETAFRKAVGAEDFLLQYQPEFTLHYQPEIDRYSGEVVGAEALIRWQHPELGLLSPGYFIALAEETGLIVRLGEWVLRTACKQAVAWRKAGFPAFHVAVNVSALQFKSPDIVQQIRKVLEDTGLEARYLELELTESMIFDKTDELVAILRELKMMGITLSIDDFGTGHSSLSNLQLLPVDKVKIDQSFVHNITTSEQDAAIVVGIIEMAHKLGLKVVAEGVETEEQLAYLHSHGCDIMQGYHLSRPMASKDFEALLVNRGETTSLN